ncbi:MAG: hypothetical protein GXP24_00505 [Planctomycetes bacterium]|nr:hypothetical protein [Planctomycetota bacterium]
MARSFSAVMALIGMVVVMLRGMKDGAGFDGTVATALSWMVLLGAIGMVVGFIAAQTVDESVRTKIEAELAALSGANDTNESTNVA